MNCLRLIRLNPLHMTLSRLGTVKFISHHPFKFTESQDKWRQIDQMSDRWDLVYKAPMGTVLNFSSAYLTASSTILSAGAVYYSLFMFDITKLNDPIIIGDDVVIANNMYESLIYVGAYIMFHVALKILLSKFVVRLYKNGDEYTAVYRGNWYNSISKHKFHLNEFKKLNPTLVVSWGESRYALGKRHGILLDNYFKSPEYLNYLITKNKIG